MAIGAWLVEASIRYTGNGISFMERQAAATNLAAIKEAQLTGNISAREAAYLRMTRAADAAGGARLAAFSNMSAGVAVVGGASLGFAIDQAANMERAMFNLKIATHSSKLQMDAFKDSVYATAAATAQSAPTIAAIYGSIASTSGLPASSLTPDFLSKVTKFGEIVQLKSVGTAHEYSALEAATQLIELAHQYRAYTPVEISGFAEMLHKATYFMPGGLSQFLTQSKYFTPLMALSPGNADAMEQSVLLGILMQQTGLGRGRGGTGVGAFERQIIQGLTLTGHAQAGRRSALAAMGLIDPSTGRTPFVRTNAENQTYFDVIGALGQIQKYADAQTRGLTGSARSHEEEIVLRNAFSALGVQGSLIALVAAGGGLQQMRNVQSRMRNIPSIDSDQSQRLQLFWGAVQRVTSGLGSLGSALGTPGLGQLTPKISAFADVINRMTKDLEMHPGKATLIFNGLEIASGLAAIGFAARVVVPAVKFVGVGLTMAGSGILTFGKLVDRVFLRGIGAEATGAIGDLARALGVTEGAITSTAGALLKFANLWGTIFMAFNNDAPDLRRGGGPAYGTPGYWQAWKRAYVPAGQLPPSSKDVQQFDRTMNPTRSSTTVHVGEVHVNFPNVTSGQEASRAIDSTFADPLSPLYSSSPGVRTHPRIPQTHTVPPR